jgi:hypothetical protein
MSTVGIICPHPDDVALSCSLLLLEHTGSIVSTVFAGGPEHVDPLSAWDVACGVFHPGDDVAVRGAPRTLTPAPSSGHDISTSSIGKLSTATKHTGTPGRRRTSLRVMAGRESG